MQKFLLISILGIAVAGICFGLVGPVTVILLEKNHTPSLITGIVTTALYVSVVLFSSLTGKLIDRYNVKRIISLGFLLVFISSLGLIFWRNYIILFSTRFILGIGVTFVFVATEVIINSVSDDSRRGHNIGLYVVSLSAGIAIGTMLIWTVRIYEWLPFVIGAAFIFIVMIFEGLLLGDLKTEAGEIQAKVKFPVRLMPLIALFSAAIYGIFESSITVVIPLFGLRSNYSDVQVSYFLAAYVIGGIVLLYFIGRYSDKFSKYSLLVIIALILGSLFVLPGFFSDPVILAIIFFLIGGLVPAFYTVGLTYTVEKVSRGEIAQANGHFAMFYGLGTLLGPVFGSMLVEFNRQYAYWIASSIICFLFFLLFYASGSGRKAAE